MRLQTTPMVTEAGHPATNGAGAVELFSLAAELAGVRVTFYRGQQVTGQQLADLHALLQRVRK